jgi:hypothetical protein
VSHFVALKSWHSRFSRLPARLISVNLVNYAELRSTVVVYITLLHFKEFITRYLSTYLLSWDISLAWTEPSQLMPPLFYYRQFRQCLASEVLCLNTFFTNLHQRQFFLSQQDSPGNFVSQMFVLSSRSQKSERSDTFVYRVDTWNDKCLTCDIFHLPRYTVSFIPR